MTEDSVEAPVSPLTPPPSTLPSPRTFQPYAAAPEPYASAPMPASPATDEPDATTPTPPPNRRRLRWVWWTAGSLVVASIVGLCAYLVVVTNQWSDRVDQLTVVSQDLGTQVSQQTTARETAESKSVTLQSQLDMATARITVLADEEANATDHEAVWIDLVDAFIECESGWAEHATVLKGNYRYTGISTAAAEAELVAYCDGLVTEYTAFKTEIGK